MSSAGAKTARGRLWFAGLYASLALGLVATATTISMRLIDEPFAGFLLWENGVLSQFYSSDWTGPVAGLPLSNGRVVSVDGDPFEGGAALLAHTASLPIGTPIRYGILQAGVTTEYTVATMRLSQRGYFETFGSYLITGVFFFLIALTALYMRPDRSAARALVLVATSVALVFVFAAQYLASCRFVFLPLAAEAAAPVAVMQFALVFPYARLTRTTRRRILAALATLHGLLLAATLLLFNTAPAWADRLALVPNATASLIALATLVGLAQVFVAERKPEARLQAGIVFVGAAAAFLLPAIIILVSIMLGWPFSFNGVAAPLSIFPISVLYAVVRHDLLGAERFIRLTVGYTFATSAVVLGYATLVIALDQSVSAITAIGPAAGFVLLIAMAISFEPLRLRAQSAVDRIFFRSSIDPGRILEQSSDELATLSGSAEIARRVAERVCNALALEWAQYLSPEQSGEQAEVLEPIKFRDEVLGFLACGPKLSGAPFSSAERDLIHGIAGQAAVALRNANSIRDLSEAQAEILRTEHLAAIGEFAGVVVHGIRGPLAGMRAATQIAQEQSEERAVVTTLESVLSEADRLNERIRMLLDYARPRAPGPPQPTDLRDVIESTRSAIAARSLRQGVELAVETPTDLPRVHTDAAYIEQCLLELTHNALEAMPHGGLLRLEIGLREAEERQIFIRVSDTGTGIPSGAHARVFELFYTTRPEGMGMGLATVKLNLERLGGRIKLEGSTEKGTSFRIDLPVREGT